MILRISQVNAAACLACLERQDAHGERSDTWHDIFSSPVVWFPHWAKGWHLPLLGPCCKRAAFRFVCASLTLPERRSRHDVPFEHGEVFVTDDGAETDLDLGHYERFTGVPARNTDSVSSGRIYSTVLEKERRGDYLGKTIQVIPMSPTRSKSSSSRRDEVDFMLCEIGGTVGDIEGLPFFEASASSARTSRAASAFSCI